MSTESDQKDSHQQRLGQDEKSHWWGRKIAPHSEGAIIAGATFGTVFAAVAALASTIAVMLVAVFLDQLALCTFGSFSECTLL